MDIDVPIEFFVDLLENEENRFRRLAVNDYLDFSGYTKNFYYIPVIKVLDYGLKHIVRDVLLSGRVYNKYDNIYPCPICREVKEQQEYKGVCVDCYRDSEQLNRHLKRKQMFLYRLRKGYNTRHAVEYLVYIPNWQREYEKEVKTWM